MVFGAGEAFCTPSLLFLLFHSFYSRMAKANINMRMTDTHSQEDDSPKEHPFLYYGKAAEKIIPVTAASSNPSTALNLLCYQTKHSSTLYGDNMHQQSIIEPLWEDKLSDIEDHRATVPISTPPPADSWYAIFFKTPLVPVSRGKQWHVVFSYTMAFLMVAIMSGEFMMNHELSGKNEP